MFLGLTPGQSDLSNLLKSDPDDFTRKCLSQKVRKYDFFRIFQVLNMHAYQLIVKVILRFIVFNIKTRFNYLKST